MSTTVAIDGYLHRAVAHRKQAAERELVPATPPQPNQPPLDFTDHEPIDAKVVAPDDGGVRVSMVKARLSRETASRAT